MNLAKAYNAISGYLKKSTFHKGLVIPCIFLFVFLNTLTGCPSPAGPGSGTGEVTGGPAEGRITFSFSSSANLNTGTEKATLNKGQNITITVTNANLFSGINFSWFLNNTLIPGESGHFLVVNTNDYPFDISPTAEENVVYRISILAITANGMPYSANAEITVIP